MRFPCFPSSNINENEDLMPHTSLGGKIRWALFCGKLNQVQQASPQPLEGYKNRTTRELKIYHKAPRVSPAETQSTAWVEPLAP